MKKIQFTEFIKAFDFKDLFNQLGWNNFNNQLPVAVNEDAFILRGIAEKKGFVIVQCSPLPNGKIPVSNIRKQIEDRVSKHYFEHLIIYSDKDKKHQIWQLTLKEENKPKQVREVSWHSHQDVEGLFQRLKNLLFTLDEEEKITIIDVKQRISENFARNTDQVTKKFYDHFKKQHASFLDFIQGIDDHISDKDNLNKQWYASLMLNRIMFCYFIQKKGFLNQDANYLQNKLKACFEIKGKNNFYSFYRSFLLELFHDGLGKPEKKRKPNKPIDIGRIPYLNGGLFDVHELEHQFSQIQIDDSAFKNIFDFFDQWNWHLDNSIEATGRDINPDVIGYIFEKYINDRAAMGAYYTKEDITEYIGKNTIIPFLFDETERHWKEAFEANADIWLFLKNSGDNYIYDVVKFGIPTTNDLDSDLPKEVKQGFNSTLAKKLVIADTNPHLWEMRQSWNQSAPQDIALPTEIYRELIERRKKYYDIKNKIVNGEINTINDFITYNINIRQFAQDFIESTLDANFVEHFYKALNKLTILDPTCGSGAFLFAALNILEPLYEACIGRMEQFVSENPRKFIYFEKTLTDAKSERHPDLKYFIYKSIIVHNLYGVDIMKEAVEIAKLRLFLKLVATVDVNLSKDNFGLEPLPDIDFNIRAGNTLIGFATEKELYETIQKKEPLFAQEKVEIFKEDSELIGKAYSHYQNIQLVSDQGSDSFKNEKAKLNLMLKELNESLNKYLATNYGINDLDKKVEINIINEDGVVVKKFANQFNLWHGTHQPFHWFAEFYKIITIQGGFDIIIGNPPYVEYSKVKETYSLQGYDTLSSGNLYSFVVEKAILLSTINSRIGMIVPISSICTTRMAPYLSMLRKFTSWNSLFAERPARLFDGAEVQLTINLIDKQRKKQTYSTKYLKWESINRKHLFNLIGYLNATDFVKNASLPKIGSKVEVKILNNLSSKHESIGTSIVKTGKWVTYRNAGGRYYKIALNYEPTFKVNGIQKRSSTYQFLHFDTQKKADVVCAIMNSSLFFYHWVVFSDTWHMIGREVLPFPVSFEDSDILTKLCKILMRDFDKNSIKKIESRNKGKDKIELVQFSARNSKSIIDEIDTVIAELLRLTEEELDFIINYDIKYRISKTILEGEETNEYND